MGKKIRGPLIIEVYDNGKLVKRKANKRGVLGADYWRNLRYSYQLFGYPYLRTSFDYRLGGEVMDYFSATIPSMNRKVIYRRGFNTRPRKKK